MGFFGGKKKDKDKDERSGGSSTVRKSKRIIAPGGAKTATTESAAPAQPKTGPTSKSTPVAPAPSGRVQVRPSNPAPGPSSTTPARPQSKAPIQSSKPPEFAGDLASTRKTSGPSRTGDAALIEFLKGKVNLLDDAQVAQVKAKAQQENLPIDMAAVQLGFITEEQMVNALTQECWVPHLKVDRYEIRKKALDTIARDDATHYGVFPVDKLGSLLTLAMVNPLDAETIRVLESKTSLDIKKVVATRSEINQVIEKYYSGAVQAKEGSLSITQDIEPKSVTQMLAGVNAPSDKLPPARPSAPMPMPTPAPAAINPEIQDIDDLLSADDAIAPSILEPISLKAEDIELVPDATELEVAGSGLTRNSGEPALGDFEFEDTAAIAPVAKAPPKPLSPEFDLEDSSAAKDTGIYRPTPPPPKPAPARPSTQTQGRSTAAGKPATSRFTSKSAPAKPGLINLVPVMEEEFQHAITHGKSHVFEKWIGLQSRNRIINAVAVESELERVLGGLYASPIPA